MNASLLAESIEARLREVLGAPPSLRIDPADTFDRYGLDSIAAFKLSRLLGQTLGLELDMRALVEHPTLASLSAHLLSELALRTGGAIASPDLARPPASTAQPEPAPPSLTTDALIDDLVAAFERSPSLLDQLSARLGAAPAASTGSGALASVPRGTGAVDFSFIFFSTAGRQERTASYDYVRRIAQYADEAGFAAVWIPERHFLPFGGRFPDPAVLVAHLAASTRRIRLRSGSVVLPLHHPARIAESWAMVDNLSGGRVDMAFASGWNPNDFILSPDTFATLRETWIERIGLVQGLWRGEPLEFRNGRGEPKTIRIYPRPIQPELNAWMTVTSKPESFVEAGRHGWNILTMLQSRSVEQLRDLIASYRSARREHGFDPDAGCVTLMLHAFVHPDAEKVRATVDEHFLAYIESGLKGHVERMEQRPSEDELHRIAEHSFHHQYKNSALFGHPDHCAGVVRKMRAAGVNEIACLVDFGPTEDEMVETLPFIREVMERVNEGRASEPRPPGGLAPPPEPVPALWPRLAPGASHTPPEHAIIGLAGRYPGARTVGEFWNNLRSHRRSVRRIDPERLTDLGSAAVLENRHLGLLDDIYRFDPAFFGLSEREAELMDPHMRLLLEQAWLCIENAGYAPGSLAGSRTGVFVSFYNHEYAELLDHLALDAASEPYVATATGGAIMANRLSFLLDLRGPSEVYNTACSSALVALHRAVQAIEASDCDQALVAGVNLLLTDRRVRALARMGILSEQGPCNPYSHPASGESLGEGAGALLIKPLGSALAARDFVHSVISGTDVSHPGRESGGLTMPSAKALAALMAKTYRRLQAGADSIAYIEGHGSGNATDLVELVAFQELLETLGGTERKVPVGSVKSNVGFGEAAGGLAQVTKCALSLSHGMVPATLGFQRADPSFDAERALIEIQTLDTTLGDAAQRRYVSSVAFGLGGTAAHVVMRAADPGGAATTPAAAPGEACAIPLSAATPGLLAEYARRIAEPFQNAATRDRYQRLCGGERALLESISSTLATRERGQACRAVLLVRSLGALVRACDDLARDAESPDVVTSGGGPTLDDPRGLLDVCLDKRLVRELAALWTAGTDVPWTRLHDAPSRRKLALPTAPLAGRTLRLRRRETAAAPPERRLEVLRGPDGVVVELAVRSDDYFISQHVVDGQPIMPATGYLGLLSSISRTVFGLRRCVLRDVTWLAPFEVTTDSVVLRVEIGAGGRFRAYRKEDGATTLCCSGRMDLGADVDRPSIEPRLDPAALAGAKTVVEAEDYWKVADSATSKQRHGPLLRRLQRIQRVGDCLVGVMRPASVPLPLPEIALLDSALGVSLGFALEAGMAPGAALAFTLDEFHLLRPFPAQGLVYAVATARSGAGGPIDISVEDEAGVCALLRSFSVRPFDRLGPPGGAPGNSRSARRRAGTGARDARPPEPLRRPAGTPAEVRTLETEMVLTLKNLFAEFLNVDAAAVPEQETLDSLGLDSIAVHELADQAGRALGVDLPVAAMYEGGSLRGISRFLVKTRRSAVV